MQVPQALTRVDLIRDMNRTHPSSTRREAIHGGSAPASMRVMVVDQCVRFISLAVNGAAVILCLKHVGKKSMPTLQSKHLSDDMR